MDGRTMNSGLPEAFVNRMRLQLGNELPAFLRVMTEKPVRGIRMNPLKPEWTGILHAEHVPWEKNGYYLPEDMNPGTTVWHEAGVFYIQDPGAMIPVNVLNPKPGETILDLCAAPGGKSTQIAAAMRGEGILICNEPVAKRAQVLSRNLERMGAWNAAAVCAMPDALAKKWPEGFDAVLVDAPCSGEGMFRRDPAVRDEWSPEQAAGCAVRQREILRAAERMVRPGGRMVYSTCTFNPAENEENVAWFLQEYRDWETEAFYLPEVEGKDGMFTSYPHWTRGEGQFAALLRKKGCSEAHLPEDRSLRIPDRNVLKLFGDQFPMLPEGTHMLGDTVVYMPFCPDMHGIRIFRLGLHLGELRGKHVVPDHAAAWAAAAAGIQHTDVYPEAALRYMAGETVEGAEKGWTVVRLDGIPLGWGKGNDGTVKNHLPKGLRNGRLTVEMKPGNTMQEAGI